MTRSSLEWLLSVPDSANLGAFSPDQLESIRSNLVEFLGISGDKELTDKEVEDAYRLIGSGMEKLRRKVVWALRDFRFTVSTREGVVVDTKPERKIESILIETLIKSGSRVSRCKLIDCKNKMLFVKNGRQQYCSKKCSQLARIRKHRNKKTAKRFATGSQP